MKTSRVSTARREQIIDAAIAVIDEQGIQHLSLSEIEKKTGLVRGQLMYYYHSKEEILLAVFDRLLQMMHAQLHVGNGENGACDPRAAGWDHFKQFLTVFLLNPPNIPAFHSLQFTFLSQIGDRPDFRERLANLYATWRRYGAEDFSEPLARTRRVPTVAPRTMATLVQAILHGLAVQLAADPNAYDPREMLDLIVDLLDSYLQPPPAAPTSKRKRSSSIKSHTSNGRSPRSPRRGPAQPKKVNHD
jgi:AcrR family transcriptional regulator